MFESGSLRQRVFSFRDSLITCVEQTVLAVIDIPMGAVRRGIQATVDDYVEAIDYIINLVGEDCVGIGTDFHARLRSGVL
jgi:microsomal dipeptidase-like Zn-dependent dipeptidase